jgi:hypothetical protein
MAGKALQKLLDYHRNQGHILHTEYLKKGEQKGMGWGESAGGKKNWGCK